MTLWGVCTWHFVCFSAKSKQRPELEISDKTGSGGEKEAPRGDRGQERTEAEQKRESTEVRKATAKT